jgi:hypothetical protein
MFPELHLRADRRAFSLTFSITQRDAIHRLSPMPTADSAGVTGLEVAAGHGCLVMRRANVPAAGSQILPYLTRTVCGYLSGRISGRREYLCSRGEYLCSGAAGLRSPIVGIWLLASGAQDGPWHYAWASR